MANNIIALVGDSSNLTIRTAPVTGTDPLDFVSGSFRSCPEERRIAVVFLNTAGKNIKLRLEFTSGQFVEHTITGAQIYTDPTNIGIQAPNAA